jgi:hypothetical protein
LQSPNCPAGQAHDLETLSESEQAARALKIIDAYHGPRPASPPKKLHVVYFTPADREPAPRYEQRLDVILEDIRAFYREGMERLGFGPKTFALARDAQGKLIIHVVKGKEPEARYPRSWNDRLTGDPVVGGKVTGECCPVLEAAGISLESETVLIFCNLAVWDEKALTFRHHSPYAGRSTQQSGLCWAADSAIQDLADITRKEPILHEGEFGDMSLGRFNTIFIGGIAHELGHAFALPHSGERWDEKALGTSIMGIGNHTYREERRSEGRGSFLTMASAMRLATRPLFSGSEKGVAESPRLTQCSLILSTNVTRADRAGRRGALRLEGTVEGSPPVYGVIAYFDSIHDGGYRAPTATAVPDAQGRFALEVSDLAPCGNGDLRVEFCHVNGTVSEQRRGFNVSADGSVDLAQEELRRALEPVADAVAHNQLSAAQAALRKLEKGKAPELAKVIARELVGTLKDEPKPTPASVPVQVTQLALGDARAESAEVGWLVPAANRVPPNDQVTSPLLDSGKLYATGLYAHSPSRYIYELDGKWKMLRGEAGVHTPAQPYAAGVVFVIKTDGKEAFRSPVIRGATKTSYAADVSGVKTLELVVEMANSENHNNWALWLDPMLSR